MESVNAAEIADQQPAFLKDKADALFAQRNYHAALNAYTSALEREEDDSQLALACKCDLIKMIFSDTSFRTRTSAFCDI